MNRQQMTLAREEVALTTKCPGIRALDARIDHWRESGAARYSACLDIRLDQGQLLVSGEAMPDAVAAIYAAFAEAERRLASLAGRSGSARGAVRAA